MLLRSTLIYGPAILLTRVSALFLLVIITRLIDQTEYGLLTLVVTVGEMTDVAVTNWLRVSLLRLGGKGEITRGSLALTGKVLVGSTALALVIATAASVFVAKDRWAEFAIAVSAYLVAGAVGRLALTVLQMQQRHSTYSLFECLRAFLQLALPIAAIFVFGRSFLVVSLGSSAGMLIAGLAAGFAASRMVVGGAPRFTAREFFGLGAPMVVLALLNFALGNAERLFLNHYYDAGAVAIFAAAYVLARQPIDMVANAINMGAFPEVVSRFDEQGPVASTALLSQFMALMIQLCLPIAVMLAVLSNNITELMLPAEYHGRTAILFPIISLGVLCLNLTNFVYGAVVYAHKRPWLLTNASFLGSAATIILSLLLISPMAEKGAALAFLGGSVVGLIATMIVSERLAHVPIPWREIGKSVIISFAIGLAAELASYGLGDYPAIVPLLAGGAAGALAFLLMTHLFHPAETRQAIARVQSWLRRAPVPGE